MARCPFQPTTRHERIASDHQGGRQPEVAGVSTDEATRTDCVGLLLPERFHGAGFNRRRDPNGSRHDEDARSKARRPHVPTDDATRTDRVGKVCGGRPKRSHRFNRRRDPNGSRRVIAHRVQNGRQIFQPTTRPERIASRIGDPPHRHLRQFQPTTRPERIASSQPPPPKIRARWFQPTTQPERLASPSRSAA